MTRNITRSESDLSVMPTPATMATESGDGGENPDSNVPVYTLDGENTPLRTSDEFVPYSRTPVIPSVEHSEQATEFDGPTRCSDCRQTHHSRRLVVCIDGTWMVPDGSMGQFGAGCIVVTNAIREFQW